MTTKNKLLFGLIIFFMISLFSFSCDPHRRGATAGQIGASSGQKFHKKSASAKVKRRVKY